MSRFHQIKASSSRMLMDVYFINDSFQLDDKPNVKNDKDDRNIGKKDEKLYLN